MYFFAIVFLRAVVMTSPSFNLYRIVVLPAASSPTMTILVGCCDQLLMIFWIKFPMLFVFVSESVLELFFRHARSKKIRVRSRIPGQSRRGPFLEHHKRPWTLPPLPTLAESFSHPQYVLVFCKCSTTTTTRTHAPNIFRCPWFDRSNFLGQRSQKSTNCYRFCARRRSARRRLNLCFRHPGTWSFVESRGNATLFPRFSPCQT